MFKEITRATIKGAGKMTAGELRNALTPYNDMFQELDDEEFEAEMQAGFVKVDGDEVSIVVEEF